MTSVYKTTSTSQHSADVEDIVLTENPNNRWVLRATIVSKPDSSDAGVRMTLIHQRKARNETWEDVSAPGLNELKAGDHAKVSFKSQETAELYRHLTFVVDRLASASPSRQAVAADCRPAVPARRRQE